MKSSEYITWSLVWDAARRCETFDAFQEWVDEQHSTLGLELRGNFADFSGNFAKVGGELDQRAAVMVGDIRDQVGGNISEGVAAMLAKTLAKKLPRDETPTKCTTPHCGRWRPRWTMEQVGGAWACSPKFNMHCGWCCDPGDYQTHYTETEHALPCQTCGSEEHPECRCDSVAVDPGAIEWASDELAYLAERLEAARSKAGDTTLSATTRRKYRKQAEVLEAELAMQETPEQRAERFRAMGAEMAGQPIAPETLVEVVTILAEHDEAEAEARAAYPEYYGEAEPLAEADSCIWEVRHATTETPEEYCDLGVEPGNEYCPEHQRKAEALAELRKAAEGDA
jgi:hypothetical protein